MGGWLTVTWVSENAPARCAVCVLVTTPTPRVPTVAVGETEMFATRLVADCTVVELTVIPAPNVARVAPATKAVFGEPVTAHIEVVRAEGSRRRLGQGDRDHLERLPPAHFPGLLVEDAERRRPYR